MPSTGNLKNRGKQRIRETINVDSGGNMATHRVSQCVPVGLFANFSNPPPQANEKESPVL